MVSDWLFNSTPGLVVLVLWVLAMVAGALFFKRRIDGVDAAESFLSSQHLPASQAEIEGIVQLADKHGQRNLALQLFSELRRQFGHEGVRKGHVMWVLMKIEGDIPDNAVPPSYADVKSLPE